MFWVLFFPVSCLPTSHCLRKQSNLRVAFPAIEAQDFANHGTYTEPATGIQFYTSYQTNGLITGSGYNSMVSDGGFTFGMTLPPTALTVDSNEYIGLIVSKAGSKLWLQLIEFNRLARLLLEKDGVVSSTETIRGRQCQII